MKRLLFSLFIVLLILPVFPVEANDKHTCGVVSLYHLATLLGIEVSLLSKSLVVLSEERG